MTPPGVMPTVLRYDSSRRILQNESVLRQWLPGVYVIEFYGTGGFNDAVIGKNASSFKSTTD